MSGPGFDFEALSAREEYPVMHALMQRADAEIADLQLLVNYCSGVPTSTRPSEQVEGLLATYEAATAVARLDDHIQMLPVDLRAEAMACIPDDSLTVAAASDFKSATDIPHPARLRQLYMGQRMPNMSSVGYTGILNMGSSLSNLYYDVLDAADAARIEPEEIVYDDDLFAAIVRGPITPTQFIAQEVLGIQHLTPGMFIEADLAQLRESYNPAGVTLDGEDAAEIEHIIEVRRQDPNLKELAIVLTSAIQHGHARATLTRVTGLWSEHALPHVDRSVMARLEQIINSTLPLPNGVVGEIDEATIAAVHSLSPEDFI